MRKHACSVCRVGAVNRLPRSRYGRNVRFCGSECEAAYAEHVHASDPRELVPYTTDSGLRIRVPRLIRAAIDAERATPLMGAQLIGPKRPLAPSSGEPSSESQERALLRT